jgi:membrane protease YdiL (CAAX protease family)
MYFLWKKDLKTTLKSLGIPGNMKSNILYTIAGFIAIFATLFILGYILTYLGLNDQKNIMDIVNMLPAYLLVMAVVFAPIGEELLFRALLINKIRERTGSTIAAIIIAAAVFAMLHISYGSIVELTGAFAIAVILGIVYVKSKSIIPPIVIHIIFNMFSISFMLWFG